MKKILNKCIKYYHVIEGRIIKIPNISSIGVIFGDILYILVGIGVILRPYKDYEILSKVIAIVLIIMATIDILFEIWALRSESRDYS
ncbi:hypothetical protein [Flavobacterium sp.]|uniref:hypothetical protein n=1 Tax=Flavobacterium sp. TaxID=239 RepID=UPI003753A417